MRRPTKAQRREADIQRRERERQEYRRLSQSESLTLHLDDGLNERPKRKVDPFGFGDRHKTEALAEWESRQRMQLTESQEDAALAKIDEAREEFWARYEETPDERRTRYARRLAQNPSELMVGRSPYVLPPIRREPSAPWIWPDDD